MNNVQVKDVFKTRTAVTMYSVFKTRTAVVYEQCTGQGRIHTAVVMNNVQVKDVFKTRTAVVYEQCTGQGRIQNPYCCSV